MADIITGKFKADYPSESRLRLARALLEDLRYQYSDDPLSTQDDSGAIRAILAKFEEVIRIEKGK